MNHAEEVKVFRDSTYHKCEPFLQKAVKGLPVNEPKVLQCEDCGSWWGENLGLGTYGFWRISEGRARRTIRRWAKR